MHVRIQRVGRGLKRRTGAERLTCDETRTDAVGIHRRQFVRAVMDKCWVALLLLLGQSHPGLDSKEALPSPPPLRAGALGMLDATASPHPVDGTRFDGLLGTEAV